jgi:transposase InsO family protein
LVRERGYSERKACWLVGVHRSTARYKPKRQAGGAALRDRVRKLASRHKRYGYRRITRLMRREGSQINEKRVHRIWKAEGLQVSRGKRRKRRYGPQGEVLKKAEHPNHVWSYDFAHDRTEKGRQLRMLTVLDEFTRECLSIEVGHSLNSEDVIQVLEWLTLVRGHPEYLRSDNGPELVADVVQRWLAEQGSKTIYITPGSPWENAYIESFIGRLRDECLNQHLFANLGEAREIVEDWRQEYNEYRPHSSLGYRTPLEFATDQRAEGLDTLVIEALKESVLSL